MKGRSSCIDRATRFLSLGIAFVVSIYAVSNLMPLLLHVAIKGISITDGLLICANLTAGTIAVAILARAIYRVDRRAGRIRNRVGWFE